MDSRFDTLFLHARELASAEERSVFLDEACAGDPELRRRLESKLITEAEAANFFGEAVTHAHPDNPVMVPGEKPGTFIGPFKLLQQIGEGGFGTVWLADQQAPVRRRVALKIIKPGLDTKEVIARFEQERQALAMMDHANIARVFDAGATQSGRPFFVMELVRGTKITEYCDEHELGIPDRVRLFIQVCHAVHHAHQKGIIHRDIKPSNVLVTINDGEAVVKVIDFGVAKATQGSLTDATLFTQFHQMIGTPAYMSPEQAEMTSLDIDTRSDIYSLGVLLYELITGRTPIDAATLARAGLDEIRRVIREVTPARPSARMKTMSAGELTTTAKRRRTDGAKLTTSLRGDLDWIAMMCLEKDRKRRYDSANALALDLERYLGHGIVTARPPTVSYLLSRIVHRHRVVFGAAAAVFLTLLAGIAATVWMAVRAADERDRATEAEGKSEQRRKDAVAEKQRAVEQTAVKESVLSFLLRDLLLQADSSEQQKLAETADPKLTVNEALRRAAARIGDRFKDRPAEEAAIRSAIGAALKGVGDPARAVPHLERSFALQTQMHGATAPDTLLAMASLMEARNAAGQFKEAVLLGEAILKLAPAAEEAGSDFFLTVKNHLAQAYSNGGDPKRGLALEKEVVGAYAQKGPENSGEAIRSRLSLAQAYAANGRHADAVAAYEEVLKWQREHLRPDDLELAATLLGLGAAQCFLNEAGKALPLHKEALHIMESVRGAEHEETLRVMEGLARTYEMLGQRDEHRKLVEQVARGMEAALSADHPQTLRAQARLAASQFDSGDRPAGLELLERTLSRQEAILGAGHQDTLGSQSLLGRFYWNTGRFDDAISVFEKARQRSLKELGPAHAVTSNLTLNLGVNYLEKERITDGIGMFAEAREAEKAQSGSAGQSIPGLIRAHVISNEKRKRYEVAVALQRFLVETLREEPKTDPREIASEATRLGGYLLKLHKSEEARDELRRALDIFLEIEPDNWRRWVAQMLLGGALTELKQFSTAEPLLVEAHEHLGAAANVNDTYKHDVIKRLAGLYEAWEIAEPDTGKREKAAEWRKKLPTVR